MTLDDISDYLRPAQDAKNQKCSPPCSECRVFDNMHLLSLVQDLVGKEVRKALTRARKKWKVDRP